MLGMSYYDLYGFVIDAAFQTDRMYTPPKNFCQFMIQVRMIKH